MYHVSKDLYVVCFEYIIRPKDYQGKIIKKEKKIPNQQSEIEKVEERPIAA
jgi:hypothetical protein